MAYLNEKDYKFNKKKVKQMRDEIMFWVTPFITATIVLFSATTVAVGLLRYGGWLLLSNSDSCPIAEVK